MTSRNQDGAVQGDTAYGAALRRWRSAAEITSLTLARAAGVDESFIAHIERGARRPGPVTAHKLDEAVGAGGALVQCWRETQPVGQAAAARRPRQLPASPPRLLGAERALAALDDAAGTDAPLVLTGPAGVGKTVLALRWAHQHQRRWPDGVLVLSCYGRDPRHPPVSAFDLLGGILADLWGQGRRRRPAATTAERVIQLREALRGRHVLVILDDVAEDQQIRPILDSGARVLATSRSWLAALGAADDATLYHAASLPLPEAARLLTTLIGTRAARNPDAVERIAAAMDGNPRALRAAAQLILTRAGDLDTHADLLAGPDRVRHLHHAVGGDPRASMDFALHASLRAVSQPAARLLLRSSHTPTLHPEDADLAEIDELVRENLLDLDLTEGYRLPPLVRAWAASQQPPQHPGTQGRAAPLRRSGGESVRVNTHTSRVHTAA